MVISFQITKYATKMGGERMVKNSPALRWGTPSGCVGSVGAISVGTSEASTPGY